MAGDTNRDFTAVRQPLSPQTRTSAFWRHGTVFCVMLFALGFPGTLGELIGGERFSVMLQYPLFVLQIAFMLLSSGDTFMDMKIIDLKKEDFSIYLMIFVFFITSMAVTHDFGSQLITCLRFSVTGFFAMWIVQWYDVKQILILTFRAQSVLVLMCLAFMFTPMGWKIVDGQRCFAGIFSAKNVCGAQIAFGLTMQVALLRIYWRDNEQPSAFFYFIMLCQLIIVVMSRAFGSLLSGGIPIAILLASRSNRGFLRRLPLGSLFVLGSVGFLVFALTLMPLAEPLLTAIGKDATLTGRIPMWQTHVNNMLSSHTFTGYGFGKFWDNTEAVAAFHAAFDENSWAGNMTSGAHNELIELWLDVGLVGIAAYFIMLFSAFSRPRAMSDEAYILCIAVGLSVFIKGLTERTHTPASYWTLYLFITAAQALKSKVQSSAPVPVIRS